MSQFIKEKIEYSIDRKEFTAELEKLTFLNVYTAHPYLSGSHSTIDYSRLEIFLDTHVCDSDGNEIKEFNYDTEIGYQEIMENPNFASDLIKTVEEKYRAFYIDYCENEIKFLQEKIEELKKS